jgi:hypothetical protein
MEETKKPQLTPLGKSSGINVGPFKVQLCGPVVEKMKDLEICGPNVEIKLRDPNEIITDFFEPANQCSPQCGVCHPDVCKPGATYGSGTCPPAVMSVGKAIEWVINPVLEHQKEIDRKIEKILESIKSLESKIKK